MIACKADSRGRTGFENVEYNQVEYINDLATACLQITAKQFVEKGILGKEIGEAMAKERVNVIANLKKNQR